MRVWGVVIGVLLVLVGVIWILQGLNVLGGSVMSGRPTFAILGALLVVAGALVLARTARRGAGGPGPAPRISPPAPSSTRQ